MLTPDVSGHTSHYGEDCDLWIRLALLSDVSVTQQPLAWMTPPRPSGRMSRLVQAVWQDGKLVPNFELRSLCQRRLGEVAMFLAGLYFDRGKHAARNSDRLLPLFRSRPRWWWGAVKALLRPVVQFPSCPRTDARDKG